MFTKMIAEFEVRKDTFLKMCLFVLIFRYLLIFLFLQYFRGRGRVKSVIIGHFYSKCSSAIILTI